MGFGENLFFLLNFFLYEYPTSSVRHVSSFYDQKELKAISFLVLTHFTISLKKFWHSNILSEILVLLFFKIQTGSYMINT